MTAAATYRGKPYRITYIDGLGHILHYMVLLEIADGRQHCRNCGTGKACVKGECNTCYKYRWRTGKGRPEGLW